MRKLCYWFLMFVLIVSVGYLFYENNKTAAQLADLSEDVNAISKQTANIHDRIVTMEQDWQNAHGQIPAGADEIAMPTEPYAEQYADDNNYPDFYGRLYVPDAGIDVALYCGSKQYITDRVDSANLFTWKEYTGRIVADHNNQEFSKLFSVEVGMTGYIWLKNGDIINIKCGEVLNGHNTVKALTDESGACVLNSADYVMYTCRDGWQNVRICLWNEI